MFFNSSNWLQPQPRLSNYNLGFLNMCYTHTMHLYWYLIILLILLDSIFFLSCILYSFYNYYELLFPVCTKLCLFVNKAGGHVEFYFFFNCIVRQGVTCMQCTIWYSINSNPTEARMRAPFRLTTWSTPWKFKLCLQL